MGGNCWNRRLLESVRFVDSLFIWIHDDIWRHSGQSDGQRVSEVESSGLVFLLVTCFSVRHNFPLLPGVLAKWNWGTLKKRPGVYLRWTSINPVRVAIRLVHDLSYGVRPQYS